MSKIVPMLQLFQTAAGGGEFGVVTALENCHQTMMPHYQQTDVSSGWNHPRWTPSEPNKFNLVQSSRNPCGFWVFWFGAVCGWREGTRADWPPALPRASTLCCSTDSAHASVNFSVLVWVEPGLYDLGHRVVAQFQGVSGLLLRDPQRSLTRGATLNEYPVASLSELDPLCSSFTPGTSWPLNAAMAARPSHQVPPSLTVWLSALAHWASSPGIIIIIMILYRIVIINNSNKTQHRMQLPLPVML